MENTNEIPSDNEFCTAQEQELSCCKIALLLAINLCFAVTFFKKMNLVVFFCWVSISIFLFSQIKCLLTSLFKFEDLTKTSLCKNSETKLEDFLRKLLSNSYFYLNEFCQIIRKCIMGKDIYYTVKVLYLEFLE